MKKVFLIFATLLLVNPIFAENNNSESDWKEKGKTALEETGNFFKKAGQSVKESIDNASEIQCYGTWYYQSDSCLTTFICRENGTMEISKKIGTETDYWKGTYSATFKIITFNISESGRKGAFVNKKGSNNNPVWHITYSLQNDGKLLKLSCGDIPTDIDGTDFGRGIFFSPQK